LYCLQLGEFYEAAYTAKGIKLIKNSLVTAINGSGGKVWSCGAQRTGGGRLQGAQQLFPSIQQRFVQQRTIQAGTQKLI
jgi:hypothetical protein